MSQRAAPLPDMSAKYVLTKTTSEADFTDAVIEYARLRSWLVFHELPAWTLKGYRSLTQGDIGFPDLVLARKGDVLFAELKSERGRLTKEQTRWLEQLEGFECAAFYLWRPSDWNFIEERLR